MSLSLNKAALVADLGNYCRENMRDLFPSLVYSADLFSHYGVQPDVKDETPLIRTEMADIAKPWASTFSPTANALSFKTRMLKARLCKADLAFIPQEFHGTWIQMIAKKKVSKDELPFYEFIVLRVMEKIKENIRLQALWKGVYNAAGTTSAAMFDGFLALLTSADVGAAFILTTSGVLTTATIVDEVTNVYKKLHEGLKASQKTIYVYLSPNNLELYKEAVRALYPNWAFMPTGAGDRPVDYLYGHSNVQLIGEPGLIGSNKIVATYEDNFVIGYDGDLDGFDLTVEKMERQIKLLADFKIGVQIAEIGNGAVAMNDRA
jgi:hypothetical protein